MENNSTQSSIFKSNFALRLMSSVILLPIIITVSLSGGFLYLLLLIIAAYIACSEFSYMCGRWSFGIDTMGLITVVCLATTAFYMNALLIGVGILIVGMYLCYFLTKIRKSSESNLCSVIPSYINRPFFMAVGAVYIGLAFSALGYLRNYGMGGNITVLWIFGLVICSDVGAYIFGSIIKGVKLAPFISPNKTWSGFIGAIFLCFAISYIAASLLNLPHTLDVSIFGAIVAVVAHIGDLLESAFKRYTQVKDSGNLIPGHGGILDRIDALMLVAIVTAVICFITGKSILFI